MIYLPGSAARQAAPALNLLAGAQWLRQAGAMRVKSDVPVPDLVKQLREFAQDLENGPGAADREQWYAGRIDTLEAICWHYFEDSEFADGLLTDRYWHIMRGSVPDTVYGPGVFRRELGYQVRRIRQLCEQLEAMQRYANAGAGVIAVPDSNIFVHCGELKDIDWRAVVGKPVVRVVVPLVVVSELDELKYTLRDKPERGLLRKNIRQLRDALQAVSPGMPVAFGDGVTLAVLPDPPGHRRLPVNDEEICSRAALLKSFGARVVLVSNDVNAQIRAWGFSLETVEVPELHL